MKVFIAKGVINTVVNFRVTTTRLNVPVIARDKADAASQVARHYNVPMHEAARCVTERVVNA